MSISVSVVGGAIPDLQRRINKMRKNAPTSGAEVANQIADFLAKQVRQYASGRPGPQVITGAYRASIQVVEKAQPGEYADAVVSTNAPQAARLEFGFAGVDRLSRHYHQPPFPHWRPGLYDTLGQLPRYKKILYFMITGG